MENDPLTNEELAQLNAAGWQIGSGGLYDGVVMVRGVNYTNGTTSVLLTRAEWRKRIANFPVDELSSLRAQLAAADKELTKTQDELYSATAGRNSARKEAEAYRAVVDDAIKRYSFLFEGWRKAQSNEEIADVVRKAMFNWEETRNSLYLAALKEAGDG